MIIVGPYDNLVLSVCEGRSLSFIVLPSFILVSGSAFKAARVVWRVEAMRLRTREVEDVLFWIKSSEGGSKA